VIWFLTWPAGLIVTYFFIVWTQKFLDEEKDSSR
jgi:hypothetical protein